MTICTARQAPLLAEMRSRPKLCVAVARPIAVAFFGDDMIWTHCTDAFVHIHAHNTRTFVIRHERQTLVPRFGLRNDFFICFR